MSVQSCGLKATGPVIKAPVRAGVAANRLVKIVGFVVIRLFVGLLAFNAGFAEIPDRPDAGRACCR